MSEASFKLPDHGCIYRTFANVGMHAQGGGVDQNITGRNICQAYRYLYKENALAENRALFRCALRLSILAAPSVWNP